MNSQNTGEDSNKLKAEIERLRSVNRALLDQLDRHRKIEAKLDLFGRVVEQSAEMVLITDPVGTILYVNNSFEKTTGFSRNEVTDTSVYGLYGEEYDDEFYRGIWQEISDNGFWKGELLSKRKDGSQFNECVTIFPILDYLGQTKSYVKLSTDITEKIKLEDQLRRSQKMEAIGRLAGGIAHDFNNLLTGIKGNVELARMEFLPDTPLMPFIDEIDDITDKAVDLVRHLLAFSKRRVVAPRVINLNEVIQGLEKMIRRVIGENIYLNTHLERKARPVLIDISQVEQIIMNLVINSKDAMPDGGELKIETKTVVLENEKEIDCKIFSPGSYTVITVSDTGTGMDEETMSCIFDPFFTTKEGGTGLGLSTVYGIVSQAKGCIEAESEPGKGTRFEMMFPSIDEKPVQINGYSQFQTIILGGEESILVVEDYDILSKTIKKALTRSRYKLYIAPCADEALKYYDRAEEKPELLITDLLLPDMKGWDLAYEIEKRNPKIKILFMSGYSEDVFSDHYTLTKRSDFIEKPFNMRDMLKKIRELLDR